MCVEPGTFTRVGIPKALGTHSSHQYIKATVHGATQVYFRTMRFNVIFLVGFGILWSLLLFSFCPFFFSRTEISVICIAEVNNICFHGFTAGVDLPQVCFTSYPYLIQMSLWTFDIILWPIKTSRLLWCHECVSRMRKKLILMAKSKMLKLERVPLMTCIRNNLQSHMLMQFGGETFGRRLDECPIMPKH